MARQYAARLRIVWLMIELLTAEADAIYHLFGLRRGLFPLGRGLTTVTVGAGNAHQLVLLLLGMLKRLKTRFLIHVLN